MKRWCACALILLLNGGAGAAMPVLGATPQAEPAAGDPLITDHVVILLDASGSMNERMRGGGTFKIKAAKDALREVLQQLPATTHVGLLVFGGRLEDPWVYPLGPRDDQRLAAAINEPRADGGTPLGKFMAIAGERLLQARDAAYGYGTYRLLVVTDGEASDQKLVDRHTPLLLARGIVIDVIGVDMKSDHTLATRVQSYRRADDPESLKRALHEVLAEVGGPGDQDAAGDAFEVIAPLPDELALAMIEAIADIDNAPLDAPKVKRSARQEQAPPGASAAAGAAAAAPAADLAPAPSAAPSPADGGASSGVPVAAQGTSTPAPPRPAAAEPLADEGFFRPGSVVTALTACCGLAAAMVVVGLLLMWRKRRR